MLRFPGDWRGADAATRCLAATHSEKREAHEEGAGEDSPGEHPAALSCPSKPCPGARGAREGYDGPGRRLALLPMEQDRNPQWERQPVKRGSCAGEGGPAVRGSGALGEGQEKGHRERPATGGPRLRLGGCSWGALRLPESRDHSRRDRHRQLCQAEG